MRRDVQLIVGGRYHDVNLARARLAELLAEFNEAYTHVREDFCDTELHARTDLFVACTCDVRPESQQVEALRAALRRGARMVALHATNAFIGFDTSTGPIEGDGVRIPGAFYIPDVCHDFTDLLGSRFVTHPPIQSFKVRATGCHPVTAGLRPFTVIDEAYCASLADDVEPILVADVSSRTMQGVPEGWDRPDRPTPLAYVRRVGEGEILYIMLGHARGRWDMQPYMVECPPERGPWDTPAFAELLCRSLAWGLRKEGKLPVRSPWRAAARLRTERCCTLTPSSQS